MPKVVDGLFRQYLLVFFQRWYILSFTNLATRAFILKVMYGMEGKKGFRYRKTLIVACRKNTHIADLIDGLGVTGNSLELKYWKLLAKRKKMRGKTFFHSKHNLRVVSMNILYYQTLGLATNNSPSPSA